MTSESGRWKRREKEEKRNHSGKILALRHRDVVRAKYVNINAYLCWPFTILLSLTLVARSKAGLYRSVTGANRIDTALHPAARSYNAYAAVESWFSVRIWLHTAYVRLSAKMISDTSWELSWDAMRWVTVATWPNPNFRDVKTLYDVIFLNPQMVHH